MQLNLLGFVTFPVKMGLLNMSPELFSEAWFWSCGSKCVLEKMVFVSTESYYFVLMRLSQCLPGRIHSTYELECNYMLYLWRLNDLLTRRGLWLRDLISINELNLNTCNEAISPTFHIDIPKQDFHRDVNIFRQDRLNEMEQVLWPWLMSFVSTWHLSTTLNTQSMINI